MDLHAADHSLRSRRALLDCVDRLLAEAAVVVVEVRCYGAVAGGPAVDLVVGPAEFAAVVVVEAVVAAAGAAVAGHSSTCLVSIGRLSL